MTKSTRSGFGHHTTADEVIDGLDLAGKVALVTGASGGLGAETARALASKGAQVILTARDLAKGEGVVTDIKASTGNRAVPPSRAGGASASARPASLTSGFQAEP